MIPARMDSAHPGHCPTRTGILFLVRPGPNGRMLFDYLSDKGFEVWSANEEIGAFDLFIRHGVEIDWLVVENEFLHFVGRDFIQRFQRHFPGVKLCLLTSDPFDAEARELGWGGAAIVPKPVHLRNFVNTLGQHSKSASANRVGGRFTRHSWSGN